MFCTSGIHPHEIPSGLGLNTPRTVCTLSHNAVRSVGSNLPAVYRRPFNPTHSVPAAIQCLSRLLKERSVRTLFQRVPGSVQLLAPLLRSSTQSAAPNQQLLYEAGLCVWQLTFYEPAAEAMGSSGVVQGLVEMARSATKEKVRPQLQCHIQLQALQQAFVAVHLDTCRHCTPCCEDATCVVFLYVVLCTNATKSERLTAVLHCRCIALSHLLAFPHAHSCSLAAYILMPHYVS